MTSLPERIEDLINHLVWQEGTGPNGSAGVVRYWKDGIDISAQEAILKEINTQTIKVLEEVKEEMKMHTVPEGVGLITRSYLNNTINFKIKQLESHIEESK